MKLMPMPLGGPQLREFCRVIELAELGQDFLGHFPFVLALEAGEGVGAARVVGRQQRDLLEAALGDVLADGLVQVVVLPGDVEEIGIALLAGELRGAGVGRDEEGLALEHAGADGQHDVGEDDAGHEVDLVLLDHFLRRLLRDVGLLLVVGDDHLGRQAAELSVQVFEAEIEAVADVDAEAGAGAGQRGQHADLHLVRSLRGRGDSQHSHRGDQGRQFQLVHGASPLR
jgi:hypothetical protein